ncbi:MAG: hypothetical protein WA958_07685 [Tunicatimonas sp.]
MKKLIFSMSFVFVSVMSNAQIAEVKEDGSRLKIYDDNGYKTSISVSNSGYLGGYNSSYVVVVDGSRAKIYDAKGSYQTSISMCSSCRVQNVSGSYILIKDGSRTKYYNFKGSYVKST